MTCKQTEKKIESLLKKMTLEEKCRMTYGCDGMGCGNVESAGIPRFEMADGPQGLRFEDGRTATSLPSGMTLAATFDVGAAERYGDVIGREALATGVQASLGPGFNLMRTPMCGRNFEYYGEDPVLAGKVAAGYVRGCQANDVAATPKHLAMNNQELDRTLISSNCSMRTLRELYLRPFEIVMEESKPWMMMSSYNRINGVYASAYGLTQQKIIKDECGFDGVMVSDWGAVHDDLGPALNGLDLEMGSWGAFYSLLPELVRDGYLSEEVVDDKVRRILRMMFRTHCFDPENRAKGEVNTKRNRTEAKKLAHEGITLLKNEKNILPLNPKKIKKILVTGPGANALHSTGTMISCGGSGAVHSDYEVTPLEGVRKLFNGCEVVFEPGVEFNSNKPLIDGKLLSGAKNQQGLTAEYYLFSKDKAGKPILNPQPFRTEQLTEVDLKFGHFASPASVNNTYLDKRNFMVKLSGVLTLDSDEPKFLEFVGEGGEFTVSVNGKEVLHRMPTDILGGDGIALKGKKGDKIQLEMKLLRDGANYMAFRLLLFDDFKKGIARAAEAAKSADAVLFFGGFNHCFDHEALGWGHFLAVDVGTYSLPTHQDDLIKALCKASKNVIVSNISGEPYDVTKWIDKVAAFMQAGYCGMESGNAWAEVIAGKAVPGGRLPYSWYRQIEDCSSHAYGQYPGKLGEFTENPSVEYKEGVFIGYRYLEKQAITPVFPFGFGLNYGKIEYKLQKIKPLEVNLKNSSADFEVKVSARNIGSFVDAAVVQLYVAPIKPKADRPSKELADFGKCYLKSGEEKVLTLKLSFRDFAYFDERENKFVVDSGKYDLLVGTSSADLFGRETIELGE